MCGCVGGDSSRETPGPFPNPEAKPGYADGTALGRVWESRLPPTKNLTIYEKKHETDSVCFVLLLFLFSRGVRTWLPVPGGGRREAKSSYLLYLRRYELYLSW